MRRSSLALAIALTGILSIASSPVLARTSGPCSGKKGGVDRCENGKFMCKDGTVSRTKKICTKPS